MSDAGIEVVPQRRIDTLVTDAVTGLQRRRTEYVGTAWFGGRPQPTGFGSVQVTRPARIETPFFLPDSLPYRPDPLGDAAVTANVALQGAGGESSHVLDCRAGIVPDPRNPAVCWVQLQVLAIGRVPMAIAYRVDALVSPNAILAADAPPGDATT